MGGLITPPTMKDEYMKATNFDIRIDKETAEYLLANNSLKPTTGIMCKEYGEDEDWVGLEPEDLHNGKLDENYKTFELWS